MLAPQFLIFPDNDLWRIAATNGRLSEFSATYKNLETATALLDEAGAPYRVIGWNDDPAKDEAGYILEIVEPETVEAVLV